MYECEAYESLLTVNNYDKVDFQLDGIFLYIISSIDQKIVRKLLLRFIYKSSVQQFKICISLVSASRP